MGYGTNFTSPSFFFSFALQFSTQNALETGDLSRGPPPEIQDGKIIQNTTRIYNLTWILNEPEELSKRSTFKSYTEQEWGGDEIRSILSDFLVSARIINRMNGDTWLRHKTAWTKRNQIGSFLAVFFAGRVGPGGVDLRFSTTWLFVMVMVAINIIFIITTGSVIIW